MSKCNWVKKEMDDCYYNLDHFYCLRVASDAHGYGYYVAGFLTDNAIGHDRDSERRLSGFHPNRNTAEHILLELLSNSEDYVYGSIPSD
jgi:hypothetical protein